MKKRVYGIVGVSSIMANWNADFTGYPRTTSNGETFASDKALKYTMKRMWDSKGEKILNLKSYHDVKGEILPRNLSERYTYLFNEEDIKTKKTSDILRNLMSAIDVKNFGSTFTVEGKNLSITGAVQIGQGFNYYKDSNAEELKILSPFANPTNKEAKATTNGMKIISDEAHYFYPFWINPNEYQQYKNLGLDIEYTEEDYKKFKEACICSVSAYASNSKAGCENEFCLFIETKEDVYLPDLSRMIIFDKGTDYNEIDLNSINLLIKELEKQISSVEVYYNPYSTKIKNCIEKAKYFNIITKKEV